MGFFSRRAPVQTEEERYRAAADARTAETERRANFDAVNRKASVLAQERREARQEKRSRIKTVGEIRKVGRNKYVTTGWEIDVPDGSGRGRVVEDKGQHAGNLGGFAPAELCAIAHGPRCRRCR
ncbi:hypothetical protein [Streptomyces poriferorum]|uniref:Uncharacterized protein n=1 Tax=Streptomyces poriferorum TaxID=2798799 RepID=A0ABY9J3B6_9ACTN|nr:MULTISPECIES: hypothetical protein [unclassified Streptomyces]MDP5310425.1 hypothetical protein [Streptomyces sp. Alt4]WLQ60421.1 hypothetical protein P8A19_35580 [Streptomyces sp. Alt2]